MPDSQGEINQTTEWVTVLKDWLQSAVLAKATGFGNRLVWRAIGMTPSLRYFRKQLSRKSMLANEVAPRSLAVYWSGVLANVTDFGDIMSLWLCS